MRRIKYKVNRILINGEEPTNTKVTSLTISFLLNQCFCSCSLRAPYRMCDPLLSPGFDEHYIWVEEHYPDCPNAINKRYIGPAPCVTSEK